MPDWLTREDIDAVLEQLSADDVIEAIGDGRQAGARIAGEVFNQGAERLGLANGSKATARVKISDFQYLANRIGEVVNVDSPLPTGTGDLPPSADTGE